MSNTKPFVHYRLAAQSDIVDLAPRLRQSDVMECEALFGPGSVLETTLYGLKSDGVALVAVRDGETIAVFGVCPGDTPGVGTPWLVGTDAMDRCARELVSDARLALSVWNRFFPILRNVVDARNSKSIRWLKHLGFTVRDPKPLGLAGELFHEFDLGIQ